jgi:alpha-L-rhamnosidase
MADTAFCALNLKAIYTKWLQDITDSQLPSGNIESWAPSPVGMSTDASAAWGNSYPEVAWQLYQHYGDVSVLSKYYSSIKAYVDYELNDRGSTGLVGVESWGDWVTPTENDFSVVGTAYLYRSVTRLVQIASILGITADVTSYEAYASAVNSSFHAAFYQPATGDYRTSSAASFIQTDNILPVAFGMTNSIISQSIIDKVADNVVANSNHLETGVLGTKWILPTLTQYGYKELAYTVATQTTYPSWGYWETLGATTLWETWLATSRSKGHQFLGTIVDWFYQYLAGIQITGAGFTSVSITPYVPGDLTSTQATIVTPRGDLTSSWTNNSTHFVLTLAIPSGSTALVNLPITSGQSVYESGVAAASASGITSAGTSSGRASFNITSGYYVFTVE